jgi:hypothetical protein
MSAEEGASTGDDAGDSGLRPVDDDHSFDPQVQNAVRDALREWSRSLDGSPLPSPPAAVWERISAAIATAELSGERPRAGRLRALPGGRWTTPLVAASVVGLAFVVGANVLTGQSEPEPVLVAGAAPSVEADASRSSSTNLSVGGQAGLDGPQVLQAGFVPPARKVMDLPEKLTSSNIAQKVDELLDSVGVTEPVDVLDMPTEEWQPAADGMTSDLMVLRNCVTKVTKVATSQALLVLRANVNGIDAGLIVVPEFMVDMTSMDGMDEEKMRKMGREMGTTTIYVVEPTCGMEAPEQDPTLLRVSFTLAP